MALANINEYFAVEPAAALAGRALTFDLLVYLQINNHIVVYRRTGETLEVADLERLQRKGLKTFYIRNTDKEAYQRYMMDAGTPVDLSSEAPPPQQKVPENLAPEKLAPAKEPTLEAVP